MLSVITRNCINISSISVFWEQTRSSQKCRVTFSLLQRKFSEGQSTPPLPFEHQLVGPNVSSLSSYCHFYQLQFHQPLKSRPFTWVNIFFSQDILVSIFECRRTTRISSYLQIVTFSQGQHCPQINSHPDILLLSSFLQLLSRLVRSVYPAVPTVFQ